MLSNETRKRIEATSAGVNEPEEYDKMKVQLMAAMSEFAEGFSELMKEVAQTYKRDTDDLLAEIDRYQAALAERDQEIEQLRLQEDKRQCLKRMFNGYERLEPGAVDEELL